MKSEVFFFGVQYSSKFDAFFNCARKIRQKIQESATSVMGLSLKEVWYLDLVHMTIILLCLLRPAGIRCVFLSLAKSSKIGSFWFVDCRFYFITFNLVTTYLDPNVHLRYSYYKRFGRISWILLSRTDHVVKYFSTIGNINCQQSI